MTGNILPMNTELEGQQTDNRGTLFNLKKMYVKFTAHFVIKYNHKL